MFFLPQSATAEKSSMKFVRELYRNFRAENTREARELRLLRDWLSPGQRSQLEACGYLEVIGCNSESRYRIYKGSMSNLYELNDFGRLKMGWCFIPSGGLAVGDVMLAQKIALETNQDGALAIANRLLPRNANP
jgi:hypothetical protein